MGSSASPLAYGPPVAMADPPAGMENPVQPSGTPTVIVSGLNAPWSIVRLTSGSTLISERDSARVLELTRDGALRLVGQVDGVEPAGEGGLLGLAVHAGNPSWLYAYYTGPDDNQVVRMPLAGADGSYALGEQQVILRGIPKSSNHNGGRIAFGPDGMLYVTTGDAGTPDNAQDLTSLGGKILRVHADGRAPTDNPFPGSYVYSYGHRNPQGLAWDGSGTMWASEFGQNAWDELNRIEPGANFGWPLVEGRTTQSGFANPVLEWPTSEASPSGLTAVGDTLFMAALRGQRVWALYPHGGVAADGMTSPAAKAATAVAYFANEFGRIRDVVPGPNGTLWFLTNNTDGRGNPTTGDDKIYQVQLDPVPTLSPAASTAPGATPTRSPAPTP
ncbi:MAG: PQQ-dependent sugar dehydrogenase [Mycobacterium sp.]